MFRSNYKIFLVSILMVSFSAVAQEVNSGWQVEAGANIFSSKKSAGLASATFGSLGFDRQDLDKSSTGYKVGIRKNFDLQNGYFASSGGLLSLSSHEHSINLSTITAKVERESDARTITLDQRFGYSIDFGKKDWHHLVLRTYIGIGLNIQQTETTSSVTDNLGNQSPEKPNSTATNTFLSPVVGIELFVTRNFGLQASYTQSQLHTPDATIVTGNTTIEQGFDLVNILSFAAVYNF